MPASSTHVVTWTGTDMPAQQRVNCVSAMHVPGMYCIRPQQASTQGPEPNTCTPALPAKHSPSAPLSEANNLEQHIRCELPTEPTKYAPTAAVHRHQFHPSCPSPQLATCSERIPRRSPGDVSFTHASGQRVLLPSARCLGLPHTAASAACPAAAGPALGRKTWRQAPCQRGRRRVKRDVTTEVG